MLLAMNEDHPLAASNHLSLNDLQGQNYVDHLGCEFREGFFEELGDRDLAVRVVLRSEREDLVTDSIAESVGVSILPESVAKSAGLKTCTVNEIQIVRRISLVAVKDFELNSSLLQFIDHVVSAYES